MEVYEKRNDESQIDYIKRVTSLREEYDLSYSQWCTLVCGASYSEDNSRKAYYVVEKMLPLIDYQCSIDQAKVKKYNDLKSREIQIMKEREKQKDERRAFTKLMRTEARWEHFFEMVNEEIRNLNTDNFQMNINPYKNFSNNEAILMLSDWHTGMLVNNALNVYNKDVEITRVCNLIEQTIINCKNNDVKILNVAICGDMIEGNLNISGKILSTESVIDQLLTTSELLTNALIKLSQAIPRVNVWFTTGNHGRFEKETKNLIEADNFELILEEYVKMKIEIIKHKEKLGWNIKFHENKYPNLAIIPIENCNKKVVASHGTKDKNIKNNLNRINSYLNEHYDYCFMGHLHSPSHQYGCYVNGCLSGSSEYAQTQRYNNPPTQIMMVFFENGSVSLFEMVLLDGYKGDKNELL